MSGHLVILSIQKGVIQLKANNKLNIVLSSIVITKNEANSIVQCLHSLINSCRYSLKDTNFEIIVVDSSSIDETICLAKSTLEKFNVINYKIVNIESTKYTAALGRETGKELAKGDFLLFLDGDMFIFKKFIKLGLKYLNKNIDSNIKGVIGNRIDIIPTDGPPSITIFNHRVEEDGSILTPGGGLLVRSHSLPNPAYIKSQKNVEEESLAIRMKLMGYKINYINSNMYIHNNYKKSKRSIYELVKLTSLYLGESYALLWKQLYYDYGLVFPIKIMPKYFIKISVLFHIYFISFLIVSYYSIWISVLLTIVYFILSKTSFALYISFIVNLVRRAPNICCKLNVIEKHKKSK